MTNPNLQETIEELKYQLKYYDENLEFHRDADCCMSEALTLLKAQQWISVGDGVGDRPFELVLVAQDWTGAVFTAEYDPLGRLWRSARGGAVQDPSHWMPLPAPPPEPPQTGDRE